MAGTVVSNTLRADKTQGMPGDTFRFNGDVEVLIYVEDTGQGYLIVDVYVNGTLKRTMTAAFFPAPGRYAGSYSFTLSFDEPGAYEVYTDAYIK